MRRLSIIDLAGGHQPMSGEDGSVTIVFNGEIYNFQELKPKLQSLGHVFKTNSDTETIVHSYEEFSTSCVKHLRGMFVFAIWDEKAKTLFLARDRAGKKPLYYTETRNGSFVFGSEVKSILEHPDVEREIDLEALDSYLTLGYVPDPLSIFRNIRKLPPGHTLTYSRGQTTIEQYWDFKFEPDTSRSQESFVEELRYLLDDAVRARLISDVPLGAFLSGGIDSSTVVALMAKAMGQPVKTFSIGFREDSHNELKYARITAEKYGTDHHEFLSHRRFVRWLESWPGTLMNRLQILLRFRRTWSQSSRGSTLRSRSPETVATSCSVVIDVTWSNAIAESSGSCRRYCAQT